MKRQSLRPIAICIMFASGLPLMAQQPVKTWTPSGLASLAQGSPAASAARSTSTAKGAVEGRATDATGKPVSKATVRLRDLQTGGVANSIVSNSSGQFAFQGVNPGNYVAELVGAGDKAVAASPMVAVQSGKSVSTFISLPTMLSNAVGFVGAHAAVAAIVVASAAAAGVLTVQAQDCVSPPCGN